MKERQTQGVASEAEAALQISALSGVLTALKQAPLGIAIFDREMRYLAASSQFLTEQGLPGDTPLVGRLHYDLFPEVPQRWRDLHTLALRDGVELSHEADPFIHDGRMDWVRWSLRPWRTDDGGEIGGLVLYTEFVTPAVEARMRLEVAEARYRAVFDQAAMGVARVAPDGRFLEVNERFCAITGYGRDDLDTLTARQIIHPDDLPANLVQTEALLGGAIDQYAMETRSRTKSGDLVWVNLTASLVRDHAGEPDYFVSTIEDIEARKEAEAGQQRYQNQLRLMINELNHRVKNTLATVQSMAAQTLRTEHNPSAAYEKFEARLLGLSEVHDVLTRERWHGAALQEVAERALHPFVDAASGQVSFKGPAVRLQPGAALTMALVFHELATNAVKYGALSIPSGRVDLSWRFDEATDRLDLIWAETGGPPVTHPTHRGFGSRLIEQGLRGELRGSAAMSYAPTGFICVMRAQTPQREDAPTLFDGF